MAGKRYFERVPPSEPIGGPDERPSIQISLLVANASRPPNRMKIPTARCHVT